MTFTGHSWRNYLLLHVSILVFSFTGVFSKIASMHYNRSGLANPLLYLFLFLMLLNCGIYAIVWQKVIKNIELTTAYANKSAYLIWTQLWAVLIFKEYLTWNNIMGIIFIMIGIWVVQKYD